MSFNYIEFVISIYFFRFFSCFFFFLISRTHSHKQTPTYNSTHNSFHKLNEVSLIGNTLILIQHYYIILMVVHFLFLSPLASPFLFDSHEWLSDAKTTQKKYKTHTHTHNNKKKKTTVHIWIENQPNERNLVYAFLHRPNRFLALKHEESHKRITANHKQIFYM